MKKKILSAVLSLALLFGSAAALPQDSFADGTNIKASAATHTHSWTAVNKTVHHDEVGHWETKSKPYTVTILYSGKVVNSKEHGRPTFYEALKAVGHWDASRVIICDGDYITGTNFTSVEFGVSINGLGDIRDAIDEYYDCGSSSSCTRRVIMNTTYNSWDELSNDLAFYKSEFGLDLSYAKENCCEKTWVVDKAAYDEVVVDYYKCSCGATKDSTGKYITEYTWSDDCKKCTASKYSINNPQQATTENGTISSKVKQNATCSAKGITTYTATFKNTAFKTQTKNLADIAMTAHKWSDWNCTAINYSGGTITLTRSCTVCKKTESKSVKKAVQRLKGSGRFATAVAISTAAYPKTADTVVLANGRKFYDALAGVTLANVNGAPILLTEANTLPAETLAEIKRLGATNIIILGGSGSVGNEVKQSLSDNKLQYEIVKGSSRFATAVEIANKTKEKTQKDPTEIFFVSSDKFADALSVSAVAALKNAPIIYLPKTGDIDDVTSAYLKTMKGKIKNASVIGGSGVISNEVVKAAGKALGLTVDKTIVRVKGSTKYDTCVEVNKKFASVLKGTAICVATGEDFPDALAGGVFSAVKTAPLFLASGSLSDTQKAYLKSKNADSIYVLGGSKSVPDTLVQSVAAASV